MSDPTAHLGLLVIDLQDCFLNAVAEADSIISRTCFAIEAASLLGCSIAVTEQIPEKLGATTSRLTEKLPAHTPRFAKASFSALEADGILRWIESHRIEHLLLAGIETPICIYQTAVQAISSEIGVTLLSDCIGERRQQDRQAVLNQLHTMGAHILPSESIYYSLLGTAEHAKFKEYTQLVKSAQ